MLRVASNALIVPPFECAWLSLDDYQLEGACCLQFECKGENDVTIILKPFPGAKRWQHLQRQQGPAGDEHLAVEQNYTVILGSHRNSKLKVEKNGDEKASATGLPGCTVNSQGFTPCWINYSQGCISVGTDATGSSLSFQWQDPEPDIPNIRFIGLSCWDKHVSYRNVQVLPPLAAAQLQQLVEQQRQLQQETLRQNHHHHHHQQQQQQQQGALAGRHQQGFHSCFDTSNYSTFPASVQAATGAEDLQKQLAGHRVPSLMQVAMDSIAAALRTETLFHVLHLSELLLPRTQQLYQAAVQRAGGWFCLLAKQHLDALATLSIDVMADILHEPLLDVPELCVFQVVAAWCQYGVHHVDEDCQSSSFAGSSGTACAAAAAAGTAVRSDTAVSMSAQHIHQAQQNMQQDPQQQEQLCEQCRMDTSAAADAAAGLRSAADMVELLQLVRFAFMCDEDRQAVLQHPFAQKCPLVCELMQRDLQRFMDCTSSTAPRGAYTFEQRRLVRPTAAAATALAGSLAATTKDSAALVKQQTQLGQTVAVDPSQTPVALGSTGAAPVSTLERSGSVSSSGRAVGWLQCWRRRAPSCKELMYVCDGDRNGVIHYIGTEYGSKQWVNPVSSKALTLKASSPPSRYTDPKAVVSGQFLNTSFAGPRYIRAAAQPSAREAAAAAASSSTPSTWWQLDLGPQHRLLCNYYTIRHDGSHDGFVRSWVLQGSIDQQHWIDVRRHTNDTTIRLPGQYGSWPITGPAASMPFRAFRLLLLGPTHSPTSPWAFCLSYWELYGYFYKLGGEGGPAAHSIADLQQQQQQQQEEEQA